jgi:hypothetical protein
MPTQDAPSSAPAQAAQAKTMKRSLASLNARKAAEVPYRFEYLLDGKEPTGVFLHVIGQQAQVVQDAITAEINGRRQRNAQEAMEAAKIVEAGGTPPPVWTPVELEVEFTQAGAAVRLVGWDGIEEDYTPELGAALVRDNGDAAAQVLKASNTLGNFMKVSRPT